MYAGAARLPPSTGKCATSTSRQTAARDVHEEEEEGGREKKREFCCCGEIRGRCVFTSPPLLLLLLLLLPCAVGNQLLRTGETPFVPVCRAALPL